MVEGKVVTAAVVVSSLTVISVGLLYLRHRRPKSGRVRVGSVPEYDEKPQRHFRRVLADNSFSPFVHLRTEENGDRPSHQFTQRIRALLDQPPPKFLLEQSNEAPAGLEGPYEWVDTREQLDALAHILSNESEFAVDTEQHSYHSFHGFTALVQISTRNTDYLVDTIALHDDMNILQDIFSNPAICKVFHGADSDILWLQRDFHIYVVNMFDTAKACLVLAKPQRSLAYLLKTYCDVTTNKAFQLADWRIRPLTEDMVKYARIDAHYLLYIAQRLSFELVQQSSGEMKEYSTELGVSLKGSPLEQAWCRSVLTCLQLFQKEGVSDQSNTASTLLSRFKFLDENLSLSQLDHNPENLIVRLCEWRESVARAEDESLRCVLSDTALITLAFTCPQTPELIRSTVVAADVSFQSSDASLSPVISDSSSPVLEQYINELFGIIQSFNSARQGVSLSQTHDEATSRSYFTVILDKMYSALNFRSRLDAGLEPYSVIGQDGESSSRNGTSGSIWERKVPKNWRRGNTERSRMQFVKKFSCKAPVYHNCRIYADDGRLLCFCDRKKLDWYVRRGLAEFVQEDPPAVKLLFEPKGRPEDESNEFYIQSKSNRCVGCGESSHYLRYRIIPSCYRQHFPEYLKSHRSHDIVLLCVDCHEAAHKAAEKHKKKIAKEFGVPLFAKVLDDDGGQNQAAFADAEGDKGVSPLQLKNAAMALLRHGTTIPSQRREALEEVVKAYYGRENITQQDLRAALLVSMGSHERRRLSKRILAQSGSEMKAIESVSHQVDFNGKNERVASSEAETSRLSTVESQEVVGEEKEDVQEPSSCNHRETEDDVDKIILESLSMKKVYRHKGRKNDSLLGHAVHGRRVVDIIMKPEGDEGVRRFCQQWRAVFVEALQPAFLPPGWDISHSGRREFGEYSVYKAPSTSE